MGKESGQKVKLEHNQHLRGSMSKIRKRGMENFIGQVEIITKVTLKMMNDMAKEKCFGQMEVFMRVVGKEEYNMEWGKCSFLMEM